MKKFIVNLLFFYSIFTLHSQNQKGTLVDQIYNSPQVEAREVTLYDANVPSFNVDNYEESLTESRKKPNIILVISDQFRI